MSSNPTFVRVLWSFTGAGLASFLALALLTLHSYVAGGWVPAVILGLFVCMTWPAILAFAALLACVLLKAGPRARIVGG